MDAPEELQEWIELNEQAEEYPQIIGQKALDRSALIRVRTNNYVSLRTKPRERVLALPAFIYVPSRSRPGGP